MRLLSLPRLAFKPVRRALSASSRHYGKAVFLVIHLLVVTAFFVPVSWPAIALCVGCYYMRIFAITVGYHRYFAHRAFKTSRPFQFVLAIFGCSAVQKGPLWWAANHRKHHKHSDQEEDPHSPVKHGLWWSHVGWVISTRNDEIGEDGIPDFSKYWELRMLDDFHWVPALLLAGVCWLFGYLTGGILTDVSPIEHGWTCLVWGFIVSTVCLYHGTFLVNSVCHVLGRKRFVTGDESRNNWWVALLTMGEGWHNNHHNYMSSASIGYRWWEIDGGYYLIRALAIPRLVWGLRKVPTTKMTVS